MHHCEFLTLYHIAINVFTNFCQFAPTSAVYVSTVYFFIGSFTSHSQHVPIVHYHDMSLTEYQQGKKYDFYISLYLLDDIS